MSRLRTMLEQDKFVVTGEVAPPAGSDYSHMREMVTSLSPYCDAINVTDNQGATLHLSSLAASRAVLESGVEPIFQQTCRDRNCLALQSDLLAAWTLGLENVLAVTGDIISGGDHPKAKGVYDLNSVQLIAMTKQLNNGYALNGKELIGATDFYIGAAAFPEAERWAPQRAHAEKKVEAGARFFQTQAAMDIDLFAKRVEELRGLGVRIIAGVLLLKSERVISFVNNKLPGIQVPDHVATRLISAEDTYEEAIALAIEQAKVIKEVADGIHIMPLGDQGAVPRILKGANI